MSHSQLRLVALQVTGFCTSVSQAACGPSQGQYKQHCQNVKLTCCWHVLSFSCNLATSVSDALVPDSSSVFSRASTKRSASDCREVSLDVATLHAWHCLLPAGHVKTTFPSQADACKTGP